MAGRETFRAAPAHLALAAGEVEAGVESSLPVRLIVKGQGTVGFALARMEPFSVTVAADAWGAPAFEWRIDFRGVTLRERQAGEWVQTLRIEKPAAAVDPAQDCPYWFSFDHQNRALLYGKGEMRLGTKIAAHALPPKPAEGPDPYAWLAAIETVILGAAPSGTIDIWRDPVTAEPPLKVVRHDAISMDDAAAGLVTVAGNLTPTCQLLYDNVAGDRFVLDTPDFPHFAQAIKESIDDPQGWCARILKSKADEFGPSNVKETYLRITLGQNQGESPGIPYVMEIWPAQHFSPIHDHGGSDAVIKVLHGKIWVDMFGFLSPLHQEPFATATFEAGDVTWISPRLNQVHMLHNDDASEPCITIQCYMYAQDNRTHWPYFDYISQNAIAYFDPSSDCDFVRFKALMKEEWERRHPTAEAAAAA